MERMEYQNAIELLEDQILRIGTCPKDACVHHPGKFQPGSTHRQDLTLIGSPPNHIYGLLPLISHFLPSCRL
ncbi:hypothetical protein AVEN_70132-1 [Araneus ventricosus]|uniref:Uncharacterized protein n=1 Tax=Araneus ventricosus TaxID=182803 RepID=A0A4Y2EKL7_ARAVE|nr:hypothetical protein AVEN_70132-1 [Araneus ventricosus]